jgi:hypothetical protein
MIRLEESKALGRVIRQDDIEELSIPTWKVIREAILKGKTDEALTFLDYCYFETKTLHDSFCSFVDSLLTRIGNFDEEEVYKLLRIRWEPVIHCWLADTPGAKESLQRAIEYQRGHGGVCRITEETARYVVTCDPCGSGGQLRRTKEIVPVKKSYFWTWSKRDVPYYCVHCCVMWEILPIELRGYPIRINIIGNKPEDPCLHLYYKKPELIPEEYFVRIGQKKLNR